MNTIELIEMECENEATWSSADAGEIIVDESADDCNTKDAPEDTRTDYTRTFNLRNQEPNVEVKELTLGSRDRMSMVMEEDEDFLDGNSNTSAEELDAMLARNSMVVRNDSSDDLSSMDLVADNLFVSR